MYFASRLQAGRMLAAQITKEHLGDKCAILALNDGGVIVGLQIADQLHCPVTMLQSGEVNLPREPEALAAITDDGSMAYNPHYSSGEVNEMVGEYFTFIEQEKSHRVSELHRQTNKGDLIKRDLLVERKVIIVADGLVNGFLLDLAITFLKPIKTEKIIVATPIASVPAVDRMHILADEIFCLSVVEDYINTDHYYDKHDIPDHQKIVASIEKLVANWH